MTTILVIVGPSGSGKTTLANLLEEHGIHKVTTTTTRAMREGETDGVDYNFLSREDFLGRVEAGEFIEYASYGGNLYGCQKSDIERAVAQSEISGAPAVSIVMEIEGLLSMRRVLEHEGNVRCLFMAPDPQKIVNRLKERGLTQDDLDYRMKAIREEASNIRHMRPSDMVIGDHTLSELADIACEISVNPDFQEPEEDHDEHIIPDHNVFLTPRHKDISPTL